ncbi:DnrO protein [Luteimonas saliphila]|uniref:DnrO protein n=1 Tax=Luteimonas saliphila TaxID=2804919 RepID=UPI00192D5AC1|nr:DnrO protein [Luteimonas saliphila]
MTVKQIPLALVLAAAFAGLPTGCARGPAPAEAAGADAAAQVATDDHAGAAEHADATAIAGGDVPVADHHGPWTPDAPLIEGMSRVRTALAGLEHAGPAPPEKAVVTARAADVDAAISYMFENCVLAPEPDAALHAILARLMAGTGALRKDPADLAPVFDMEAAVENYEQLFAEPNAGDDNGGS